ncbi:LppM family (lipo)protein [Ruania zhangjianzhongii]|uniref:LppM family (lipo)protein n=1 Tax=Ruania zhangjianzhongii TaxID=2603206 RepID=UPI0011CBF10A|nr:hypothetical protein [Ruania zhangjianzhongii]
MKALQRLLLALIAVLALAGCVRVSGDVSISEEDTLSGEVTVAIDRQWLIAQGEDPDALITGIQDDLANAPEQGVTGESYDDGDYVGITLTLTQTPLDRVASSTDGMLEISHEDGEYLVTGDFSSLTESSSADAAPWQIDLAVTFPNGVTEHDGELSGSTVTWHLADGSESMNARGPAPGGGIGLVWVIVIVVVVVAALATLVWWLLRRRYGGAPVEGLRAAGARIRERHAAARGEATDSISDLGKNRPKE